MADTRDNFLDRWSRRKLARDEPVDAERKKASTLAAEAETGEPKASDDAETAAMIESLPDIETLDEQADFTAFLQDGVPEALRRQALRKLWRLNPVFANLDGLNDYDEDFTLATSALTQVKTIYQVGKGMTQAPEPAENEADEAAVPVSESTGAAESPEDPETEVQAALPEAAGEGAAEADLTEAQQAQAEPAQAVAGEAKPAKNGSAAERRWGRFKA